MNLPKLNKNKMHKPNKQKDAIRIPAIFKCVVRYENCNKLKNTIVILDDLNKWNTIDFNFCLFY